MVLNISEGARVAIEAGRLTGHVGKVERLNAAGTHVYVRDEFDGRLVRVHLDNVSQTNLPGRF